MKTNIIEGVEMTIDDCFEKYGGFIWKLVHGFKKRARKAGMDLNDLYNEGCVGLTKAFHNFDDSRGKKFLTYAGRIARGEMSQALRYKENFVRYPRSVIDTANQMAMNGMFEMADAEIARRLQVKEKTVQAARAFKFEPRYMDAQFETEEETSTLHDVWGEYADYSDIYINDFLSKITPQQKEVVAGLLAGLKHREISEEVGISITGVSNYKERVIKAYREYSELPEGWIV